MRLPRWWAERGLPAREKVGQHLVPGFDQLLSSASNVLTLIIMARLLAPAAYGQFAVAYAIVILVLGLSRGYLGTRVSLSPDPLHTAKSALGLVLVAAVPVSCAYFIALTLYVGADESSMIGVLAVAIPVVCGQDTLRFGAVAAKRAQVALASDAVWMAFILCLLVFDVPPLMALVLWLCGALVGLLLALCLTVRLPDVRGGLRLLSVRSRTGEAVLLAGVAVSAASVAYLVNAGIACGDECTGALQGAATLFSPLAIFNSLAIISFTPRLVGAGRSATRRSSVLVACLGTLGVIGWCALLLIWGSWIGPIVLGETWPAAQPLIPMLALSYIGVMSFAGVGLGLRVRGLAKPLLWTRVFSAVASVAFGLIFALLVGTVESVAWAEAAAILGASAYAWVCLLREHHAADTPPSTAAMR